MELEFPVTAVDLLTGETTLSNAESLREVKWEVNIWVPTLSCSFGSLCT